MDQKINSLINDLTKIKLPLIDFMKTYLNLSYLEPQNFVNRYFPDIDFKGFQSVLYAFFDSKDIIITIRTSSDFKFVPMVQDKSLYGHGGNKTKIYSRHGLKSREEAEYIAFKKAFEYLEKKYTE